MSRKPSNAEHRRRLRDFIHLSYGDYRWAVDMVPCPVCGAGRYLSCLPYASHGPHQVHTPRVLLSQLIPKGESLFSDWHEITAPLKHNYVKGQHDEQAEFIRHFSDPIKPNPRKL